MIAVLPEALDIQIDVQNNDTKQLFVNLTFCVTGSVHHFKNRKELAAEIEKRGGKVTGSVTGKTNYLINNDVTSTSGKNQKAQALQIPIIDEDTLVKWLESEEIKDV